LDQRRKIEDREKVWVEQQTGLQMALGPNEKGLKITKEVS